VGLLEVFVTAAIQAVTALLPIGWSGHLLLLDRLAGWPALEPAATLSVYFGLMLAVAAYFWREIGMMIVGVGQIAKGKRDADARLLLCLIVAALPILIAAAVTARIDILPKFSLTAIAWVTVGFGLVLFLADRVGVTVRRLNHMTWGGALAIGLAQILALVPGASRCGIAITIARLTGYERTETARFALVLALPVYAGTTALSAFKLIEDKTLAFDVDCYVAGGTAFIAGLIAIAATMSWVSRNSFAPFALYRVIGGTAVLGWIYFG
jgi:undecaprenyl-diphosphatase